MSASGRVIERHQGKFAAANPRFLDATSLDWQAQRETQPGL
jgi:hypothetical protein